MKPTATFEVRSINQDGSISKVLTQNYNGQIQFTIDEATTIQQRLEELNPGRKWVVVPVVK